MASRTLRWLVAIGTLLLVPEIGLRLAGARFDRQAVPLVPGVDAELRSLEADDSELFWKLAPGDGVNSEGLPGPEFAIPKPAGTKRVLFFGDSTTPALARSVADRLARLGGLAASSGPPQPVDAVSLAVPGYSSQQGLVLAKRWTERLEADAAVIAFGWNDHWQAYGASDAELAAKRRLAAAGPLGGWRTAQWLLGGPFPARREALEAPRVSLEEYRDNVTAIGDLTAARGGRVVLVTASTSHEQLGFPSFIFEQGFAANEQNALLWHRAYNAELRRIAVRRHWQIADLQRLGLELPDIAPLFRPDGIHLTEEGLAWASEAIADRLVGRR